MKREELVNEFDKHGCDIQGAVAVLRQRLVEHVRTHAEEFQDKPVDPEDYNEKLDKTRDLELNQKPATPPVQQRSDQNAAPSMSTTNTQQVTLVSQPLDAQNTISATVVTSTPSASTTVTPSNQYAIPRMSTPTSGQQVSVPSFIAEFPPVNENRRMVDQMRKWNCHFEEKDVYCKFFLPPNEIILRPRKSAWQLNGAPGR